MRRMPSTPRTPPPQASAPPPFVGRTRELQWFREQVLLPEEPTTHAICVWGPPGAGISALMTRWREEAQSTSFAGRVLSALVTGHQGSPLRVMTACAAQLRVAGAPLVAFEHLLDNLTRTPLRLSSPEQQAMRTLFIRQVQEMVHARPVHGVPVIAGMYEAVSDTTRTTFLEEHPTSALHEQQTFQERTAVLTGAFLDDLRHLATHPGPPQEGRGRRIVLFLDEITVAASELLAWVRTQVLPAALNMQLVLVLAGSEPLDHVFSTEAQSIARLALPPLSEEETRVFLASYGISEPSRVTHLWRQSGGLPLALRLLAPVPSSQAEAKADAITTGLHWIEQQGLTYHYLVRYGALFFRAFRSQDLAVCPMFSARDCIQWYRRLIALPVVHRDAITGEYAYHPLVQQQVLQRFADEARASYRPARQAVARFYQRQLEQLRQRQGERTTDTPAGQHLVLALLEQWFWLAEEGSLGRATEMILQVFDQAADPTPYLSWLRAWAQASSALARPEQSVRLAGLLLAYGEADLAQPAFLSATHELLELSGRQAGFPPALRARLYGRRAAAWLLQQQPRLALADSTQALTLDPGCADGALLQGMASAALGRPEEALLAYTRACSLDARNAWIWAHRALLHVWTHAYERAMEDVTRLLLLLPDLPEAALLRNNIAQDVEAMWRGQDDFERGRLRDFQDTEAALVQGMASCALGHYEQALTIFAQALALDPTDHRLYAGRGHVYLERGELAQAQADLAHSWELNPHDERAGLLLAWIWLCQDEPEAQGSALLETLAAQSARREEALLCRGMKHVLHQQFAEALDAFEQALELSPERSEVWFWKGLACAFLKRDQEALEALEQARHAEIPPPPVLWRPLRRVATVRPEFFQERLLPLLQSVESHSPAI